jgi:rare lipoprotein A
VSRREQQSAGLIGRASLAVLIACLTLQACSTRPTRPSPAPPSPVAVPPASTSAPSAGKPDIAAIPDAVPRFEPRSKRGNPAFYEVLGKRYTVLPSAEGYVERGIASWYGPTFHGESTSMGEKYDMYAMTAAHKTLPLPAYARVTNLRNGKSVVVRVNDRGPFVDKRIIDLSYTAAAKLDMLRDGTTLVEVRTLMPGQPDNLTRSAQTPPSTLYVQAGAFSDAANARRLVDRLQANGLSSAFVSSTLEGTPRIHRVRLGPVGSVREFDELVGRLEKLGIKDARLAAD